MKIILEEGHIWYDAALWPCDGEALKVGKVATVPASGFHDERGEYFPNTEFFVTRKEAMKLELIGVVKAVQMVVSAPMTEGNNRMAVTEDLNAPGDVEGYYVTMGDIRIQSLADRDKGGFRIIIDSFEAGWMDIALQFEGVTISFDASYIGEMPLYSLLDAVEVLDCGNEEDEHVHHTVWESEPGCLRMDLARDMGSGLLSLDLKTTSHDVDANMDAHDDSLRIWSISFPYQEFRQEVMRSALSCLKKYGLKGMTVNWMYDGIDFPLLKLINLLDDKHEDSDGHGECTTDIFEELKRVTDALKAI